MSGKNLVLELNAKMLLANQISGFLNFKISKTTGGIKWIFLHAASYLIKVISWSCKFRWVWSAMTKEAFKTLISQKLIEVESWFCACNFIFCQLSCHVGISEWIYTLVLLCRLRTNWLWVRIPLLPCNFIYIKSANYYSCNFRWAWSYNGVLLSCILFFCFWFYQCFSSTFVF